MKAEEPLLSETHIMPFSSSGLGQQQCQSLVWRRCTCSTILGDIIMCVLCVFVCTLCARLGAYLTSRHSLWCCTHSHTQKHSEMRSVWIVDGGMWAGAKLTCLLNMSLLLYTTCLAWPQPDFPTKSMCNWMRGAQAIRWCGVMMGQTHISCADASFGDFGMAWWGGKESDRYESPAPSAQRCKWRQQHHRTQTTQTAEHNAQCTHGYSV